MKIICGGQTGVDRAALDVALSLGVICGGWCPADRRDEEGIIPARYPVTELPGGDSLERTRRNVREADGTVVMHPGVPLQGGTKATADGCAEMKRPLLLVNASHSSSAEGAGQTAEFVRANQIERLNVAGPRASEWPQGYDFAAEALTKFLRPGANPRPPPKLSFIVPAHNEEHELRETLRAAGAAAEASKETYEIIVVDDASTDATADIARQLGARVVPVNRRQIAAVRNAGARVARGDVLFFVDADTHIRPGHVTGALEALAEGYSGGSARLTMDGHLPFWARTFFRGFCIVYFGLVGLGAGAFIFTRRSSFEAAGGFDEQYFAGEEVYLTLALKKLGPFKILREPIVTSARKLRMHSACSVLTKSFFIVLGGKRSLRNRKRLALWYDGKRERRAI
ncbi:MAG: YpsA SLOG family protein [Chthoniobacterales bacterium]